MTLAQDIGPCLDFYSVNESIAMSVLSNHLLCILCFHGRPRPLWSCGPLTETPIVGYSWVVPSERGRCTSPSWRRCPSLVREMVDLYIQQQRVCMHNLVLTLLCDVQGPAIDQLVCTQEEGGGGRRGGGGWKCCVYIHCCQVLAMDIHGMHKNVLQECIMGIGLWVVSLWQMWTVCTSIPTVYYCILSCCFSILSPWQPLTSDPYHTTCRESG